MRAVAVSRRPGLGRSRLSAPLVIRSPAIPAVVAKPSAGLPARSAIAQMLSPTCQVSNPIRRCACQALGIGGPALSVAIDRDVRDPLDGWCGTIPRRRGRAGRLVGLRWAGVPCSSPFAPSFLRGHSARGIPGIAHESSFLRSHPLVTTWSSSR